jgi:hypothetical protein
MLLALGEMFFHQLRAIATSAGLKTWVANQTLDVDGVLLANGAAKVSATKRARKMVSISAS